MKRLYAALLAVTFTFTTVSSDTQMLYAQNLQTAPLGELQGILQDFSPLHIPQSLGILREYQAAENQEGPFVFHVQDAHANPDAQEKIKELLQWLYDSNGKDMTIALEGIQTTIHPEYLNFFSEYPEANRAIVQSLAANGELNGVELFAWEHLNKEAEARSVKVIGTEREALYRENLHTYRELAFLEEEIGSLLSPLRKQHELAKSHVLSPELRKFIQERERRKYGNYDEGVQSPQLASYVKYLGQQVKSVLKIDLEDRFEQVRFPNLVRLLALDRLNSSIDMVQARKAEKQFLEALQKKAVSSEEERFLELLRDRGAGFSVRRVAEAAWNLAESKGIDTGRYDPYWKFLAQNILQSEIQSVGLFEEMEFLEKWLLQALTRTEQESDLVQILDDHVILEKLLSLKLIPSEHKKLTERYELIAKLVDGERIAALLPSADAGKEVTKAESQARLKGLIEKAYSFYEGAKERDGVILERTLGQSQPGDLIVLVTGGFHTDGLTELMKSSGVGYAVIQPKVTKNDGGAFYRRIIREENADLSAYTNAGQLTNQEAVYFKSLIETGAASLWEKYQIPHQEIAGKVAEVANSHPVLAGLVDASAETTAGGSSFIFEIQAGEESDVTLPAATVLLPSKTLSKADWNAHWQPVSTNIASITTAAPAAVPSVYRGRVSYVPEGITVRSSLAAPVLPGSRAELRTLDQQDESFVQRLQTISPDNDEDRSLLFAVRNAMRSGIDRTVLLNAVPPQEIRNLFTAANPQSFVNELLSMMARHERLVPLVRRAVQPEDLTTEQRLVIEYSQAVEQIQTASAGAEESRAGLYLEAVSDKTGLTERIDVRNGFVFLNLPPAAPTVNVSTPSIPSRSFTPEHVVYDTFENKAYFYDGSGSRSFLRPVSGRGSEIAITADADTNENGLHARLLAGDFVLLSSMDPKSPRAQQNYRRPRETFYADIAKQDGGKATLAFTEGGNYSIDIVSVNPDTLEPVNKADAMQHFLDANGYKPSQGAYFGNQNQTPDDRDYQVTQVNNGLAEADQLKVFAVDEHQDAVLPGAIPVGAGPAATEVKLREILAEINADSSLILTKYAFLGFDVDDTLLGVRADNQKEELSVDRASLAAVLADLAQKGVNLIFFSDSGTEKIHERIGNPLGQVLRDRGDINRLIHFYTSKMVTHSTGAVGQTANSYQIDSVYAKGRIDGETAGIIREIIGSVTDSADGVEAKGAIGRYYTGLLTTNDSGVIRGRESLALKFGNSEAFLLPATSQGHPKMLRIDENDKLADGSVASFAVMPFASSYDKSQRIPETERDPRNIVIQDIKLDPRLSNIRSELRASDTRVRFRNVLQLEYEGKLFALEIREGGTGSLDILLGEWDLEKAFIEKKDVNEFAAPNKETAFKHFLETVMGKKLPPDRGAHIGAENTSATSRDGILSRIQGLKLLAVDKDQDSVMKEAIRLGPGEDAARQELARIASLSDEELRQKYAFIGMDIDEVLLGWKRIPRKGVYRIEREHLIEDRLETANVLLSLMRRGVQLAFFSDNDTAMIQERFVLPLRDYLNQQQVSVGGRPAVIPFYTSGMVTHFKLTSNGSGTDWTIVEDRAYSKDKRIPYGVMNRILKVLGKISETETGEIVTSQDGILPYYYTQRLAENVGGRYRLRDSIRFKYPQLELGMTQHGNLSMPRVQLRDLQFMGIEKTFDRHDLPAGFVYENGMLNLEGTLFSEVDEGHVAEISIFPIVSRSLIPPASNGYSLKANLREREKDERNLLYDALITALTDEFSPPQRNELRDQKDSVFIGEPLDDKTTITRQMLDHIRVYMNVSDLVDAQQLPEKSLEEARNRALGALRTIHNRLQEIAKETQRAPYTLSNVPYELFVREFGVRPVFVAAGHATRFSSILHKTLARAGLDNTNIGYAIEGSYRTRHVRPVIVVGEKLLGQFVKDEHITGQLQNRVAFTVKSEIISNDKTINPGATDRMVPVRSEFLDEDKVASYLGIPLYGQDGKPNVEIFFTTSYGHGNHISESPAVLNNLDKGILGTQFIQIAFGEMSPSVLQGLSNPSFITYLEALAQNADAMAGGKAADKKEVQRDKKKVKIADVEGKGNFFFNNRPGALIGYADWVHIPHYAPYAEGGEPKPFGDEVWQQFTMPGRLYDASQRLALFKDLLNKQKINQSRYDQLVAEVRAEFPYFSITAGGVLMTTDDQVDYSQSVPGRIPPQPGTLEYVQSQLSLIRQPLAELDGELDSGAITREEYEERYAAEVRKMLPRIKDLRKGNEALKVTGNPYLTISDDGVLFTQELILAAREDLLKWNELPPSRKRFLTHHLAVFEKDGQADIMISSNTGVFRESKIRDVHDQIIEEFNKGGFDNHEGNWEKFLKDPQNNPYPKRKLFRFWKVDPKAGSVTVNGQKYSLAETGSLAWTLVELIAEDDPANKTGFVPVGEKTPSSIKDADRQIKFREDLLKESPRRKRTPLFKTPLKPQEQRDFEEIRDLLVRNQEGVVERLQAMLQNKSDLSRFHFVVEALLADSYNQLWQFQLIKALLELHRRGSESDALAAPSNSVVQVKIDLLLGEAVDSGALTGNIEQISTNPKYAKIFTDLRNHFKKLAKKDSEYVLQRLAEAVTEKLYSAQPKSVSEFFSMRQNRIFKYPAIAKEEGGILFDELQKGEKRIDRVISSTGGTAIQALHSKVFKILGLLDPRYKDLKSFIVIVPSIDDGGNSYKVVQVYNEGGYGIIVPVGDIGNALSGLIHEGVAKHLMGNAGRIPKDFRGSLTLGIRSAIKNSIADPSVELSDDFFFFSRVLLELIRNADDLNVEIVENEAGLSEASEPLEAANTSIRNAVIVGAARDTGVLTAPSAAKVGTNALATPAAQRLFQQGIDNVSTLAGAAYGKVTATVSSFEAKTFYALYNGYTLLLRKGDKTHSLAITSKENGNVIEVRNQFPLLSDGVTTGRSPVLINLGPGESVSVDDPTLKLGITGVTISNRDGQIVLALEGVDKIDGEDIKAAESMEWVIDEAGQNFNNIHLRPGVDNPAKPVPLAMDGTGRALSRQDTTLEVPVFSLANETEIFIRNRVNKMQTNVTETTDITGIQHAALLDKGLGYEGAVPELGVNIGLAPNDPLLQRLGSEANLKDLHVLGPASSFTSMAVHFAVKGFGRQLSLARRNQNSVVFLMNATYDNENAGYDPAGIGQFTGKTPFDLLNEFALAVERAGRAIPLQSMISDLVVLGPHPHIGPNILGEIDQVTEDVLVDRPELSKRLDKLDELVMEKLAHEKLGTEATDKEIAEFASLLHALYPRVKMTIRTDPSAPSDDAKKARGPLIMTKEDFENALNTQEEKETFRKTNLWHGIKIHFLDPRKALYVQAEQKRGAKATELDYRAFYRPEAIAEVIAEIVRENPRYELRDTSDQPRSELRSLSEVDRLLAPDQFEDIEDIATTATARRASDFARTVPVTAEFSEEMERMAEYASDIYATYAQVARILNVTPEEAFALVIRNIVVESVADQAKYNEVIGAAKEILGPDLFNALMEETAEKQLFVAQDLNSDELQSEEEQLLFAFTLLARPNQNYKIYYIPDDDEPIERADVLAPLLEKVAKLGGNPKAVQQRVAVEIGRFSALDEVRRAMLRDATGRHESEEPVVLSNNRDLLDSFGFVRNLGRLDRKNLSYSRATFLVQAVSLRQDVVNMMQALESRGFSREDILGKLGRLMQALQKIATAA